ncbi:MAG: hypothetical protein Hyperionvirus2_122 [Hyperionvirus sp.]|uniref:Uncharacterized protein n=1 Tax=Hyperionvirus sp. TaxID=2487770 RepID=A0A3G5A899_9VIRU|nr:MAG: hypothetical protein Hyperionvirus2_122 [Hyperionvirus sp.]
MRRFIFIATRTKFIRRIPFRAYNARPIIAARSYAPKVIAAAIGIAAAVPLVAAAAPEKKAIYHDKAIAHFKNKDWITHLNSPEKNLKAFVQTLEYALYCTKNAPEFKTISKIQFDELIKKLIELDTNANINKPASKFKMHYLKIFDDAYGFNNLSKPVEIINTLVRLRLEWTSPIWLNILLKIHNESTEKEIVNELISFTPANYTTIRLPPYDNSNPVYEQTEALFNIIKTMISRSKKKIIVDGYYKLLYDYERFYFFASNDLIRSSETGQYLVQVLAVEKFSHQEVYKILKYLIALNPHVSAQRELLIPILVKLGNSHDDETKAFLSFLVNTIVVGQSLEEREALGEIYQRVRYRSGLGYDGSYAFAAYISSKHPQFPTG